MDVEEVTIGERGSDDGARNGARSRDTGPTADHGNSDGDHNPGNPPAGADSTTDVGGSQDSDSGGTGQPGGGEAGGGSGEPRKRRRRRSSGGAGADDTEAEDVQEVGEPETISFSTPPPPKTKRRRNTKDKITVDGCATILSVGFGAIGLTRPIPLQPAWALSVEECKPVGEHLAACLGGLPEHIFNTVMNVTEPVACLMGIYSLYNIIKNREEQIKEYYRGYQSQQPTGTPAGPSVFSEAQGSGERPTKPSDLNYE